MKKIVRVYVIDPKSKREKGVMEPEEIMKVLSKPTESIELDYDEGQNVRMGNSSELIGETVKIGEFELEIPVH
jgi:hypothetical protein